MEETDSKEDPMRSSPHPFDALERVQAAMGPLDSTNSLLSAVLDEVLELFDCDRAWLGYPCSLESESFSIQMERTRPDWPGAEKKGQALPVDDFIRRFFEQCLETTEPVGTLVSPTAIEPGEKLLLEFGVKSMLAMAIRPTGDQPWVLGIHDCKAAKEYEQDIPLFRAIGRRLQDSLTAFFAIRALKQSEERFRILVDQAPEAIVIYDVDEDRFIEANQNAAKLFGLTRRDLGKAGGPARFSPELQPSGERSAVAAAGYIESALAGAVPSFVWMHQDAAGNQVPCEVRLVRLPHPRRRLIRGSMVDITERRRAEADRAELEARLAQSQKMEAIGQLSGGVAHDFNNLLTVILGNLELLDESQDDPAIVKSCVADIRNAAERARSLTHRLLAFSRRQPLNPTAVDLVGLLRGMDSLLRRTLREDIDIDLVLGGGLWRCEVDETQLQSAILNLVINARDAMPDGGRLTIEANNSRLDVEYADRHEEVKPGQYVCLAVSDNGTGVPAEELDRIFTPFFTTKAVGMGSGLGLSMVYGFVKQSGGHMKVYSEVGVGTTMKLYLPRATVETSTKSRSHSPTEVRMGRGECVLVVEDADDVRTLTRTILLQLGYTVLEASDGPTALEVLAEHPEVVLLFTDVVLPGGLNGAQLARAARERRPELLVLYMSGYTENAIIHHGRLDPDVRLVEKPFTKRTLALRIQESLASRNE